MPPCYASAMYISTLLFSFLIEGILAVGINVQAPKHVFLGQSFKMECIVPTETLNNSLALDWKRITQDGRLESVATYRIIKNTPPRVYLNFAERFSVRNPPYTELDVSSAEIGDSGEYVCELLVGASSNPSLRDSAHVQVIKLPTGHLKSSIEEGSVVREGDEIAMNCSSSGSYPRSDIIWKLDGVPLDESPAVRLEEFWKDEEDGTFTSVVQSVIRVQDHHLGKTLTCSAIIDSYGQVFTADFYLSSSNVVAASTLTTFLLLTLQLFTFLS